MTTLKEELKTSVDFASPEYEAFLSLLVTSDRLNRRNTEFMAEYGVSPKQYNILRILRGAGKKGLPVMEIGRRMIEKSPDISRIINRLIENKLVVRRRRRTDRRVVMVSISTKGEELLQKMDEPVRLETVKMLSGMSRERLLDLIVLLQDVRDSLYSNSPA